MKPQNEVSRTPTKLHCRECHSLILHIYGEFSCTKNCGCLTTVNYYWCDECEEEYDLGELTIKGSG